ncbi:MAG TPA: beta-eliminating lyase-related protein [Aliidongia sp.]|nr:beta-eliminating lyase-related protein [Aliidongia sp.]
MSADPRAIRAQCTRILSGHRQKTGRQWFEALAQSSFAELPPDTYGEGAAIHALEHEVAGLLGKPAALFSPKGVITQQVALRLWTEQSGVATVALHPKCHIAVDERDAIERLHHLPLTRLGNDFSPFTAADLDGAAEVLGAVTVELPLRRAGFKLTPWDELQAISDWCRDRSVPFHLDGARLWESQPYYGKPLHEIAALADSVYVSLYKGLGGLAGCMLAGPEDFIKSARVWQARHGGFLPHAFPYVVSALEGLRHHLPLMPNYVARARSVAASLAELDGVRIVPEPPQTNGFQIYLPAAPAALEAAHLRLAERERAWLFGRFAPTALPDMAMVEISVGDALEDWTDSEITGAVGRLIDLAQDGG